MPRRRTPILRIGDRLQLDIGRLRRTGIPEIVLAEGKSVRDVRDAAVALARAHGRAIVTRLERRIPWGNLPGFEVERHPEARIAILKRKVRAGQRTGGRVAILTAGATDWPVAAEGEIVANEVGCDVRVERDVGVAGLTRVTAALARLAPWRPHVYIVVAGREGALAPVTAGLVDAPVIGVPVSSGYGRGGKGEAALSTMLQSCAPLVTVNIDAGVIAGLVAAQIANKVGREENHRTPRRRAGRR